MSDGGVMFPPLVESGKQMREAKQVKASVTLVIWEAFVLNIVLIHTHTSDELPQQTCCTEQCGNLL